MVGEGVQVMGMAMVIVMITKQRIYIPHCSLYRLGRSIGGWEGEQILMAILMLIVMFMLIIC